MARAQTATSNGTKNDSSTGSGDDESDVVVGGTVKLQELEPEPKPVFIQRRASVAARGMTQAAMMGEESEDDFSLEKPRRRANLKKSLSKAPKATSKKSAPNRHKLGKVKKGALREADMSSNTSSTVDHNQDDDEPSTSSSEEIVKVSRKRAKSKASSKKKSKATSKKSRRKTTPSTSEESSTEVYTEPTKKRRKRAASSSEDDIAVSYADTSDDVDDDSETTTDDEAISASSTEVQFVAEKKVKKKAAVQPIEEDPIVCQICDKADDEEFLLCESCDEGMHLHCTVPRLPRIPPGDWFCLNHQQLPYCDVCRGAITKEQHVGAMVCNDCFVSFHSDCVPADPPEMEKRDVDAPWVCHQCVPLHHAQIERLLAKRFRPKRTRHGHHVQHSQSQSQSQSQAQSQSQPPPSESQPPPSESQPPPSESQPPPSASQPQSQAPPNSVDASSTPKKPASGDVKAPGTPGTNSKSVKAHDEVPLQSPYEYFVRYEGLGNVHNRWIPEHRLQLLLPPRDVGIRSVIKAFNSTWRRKFGAEFDEDPDYLRDCFNNDEVQDGIVAESVTAERVVVARRRVEKRRKKNSKTSKKKKKQRKTGKGDNDDGDDAADDVDDDDDDSSSHEPGNMNLYDYVLKYPERCEFLIKWNGLQYDECTWERGRFVVRTLECMPLIEQYVERQDYARHQRRMVMVSKGGERVSLKEASKEWVQPDNLGNEQLRLHSFQLEGIRWLHYNWATRKSCILADEMGLGKTIQTIGLVVAMNKYSIRPVLVCVPLSTVTNWMREFNTWAPSLNVVSYLGNEDARKTIRAYEFHYLDDRGVPLNKKNTTIDVLVTSYEMVSRTEASFKHIDFEAIIIDEAHRLKSGTKGLLFKKLNEHRSHFRVLLTGTPLQNNLLELFNLLEFLDKNKFDADQLMAEFDGTDEKDQIERIHDMLRTRLLRRMKKDVFDNLPQKTELIVPVDMSYFQKTYYKAILEKNYAVLKAGRSGGQKSLMNVVMQLRKCCNHPYLFEGAEPDFEDDTPDDEHLRRMIRACGKMLVLDKMLMRLRETGHRVLIFSQMTRVLDILEDYCHYRNFGVQRIDGGVGSYERQQRIDAFNREDSTDFVFLLTTRAGGQGINLATADTVITYDSDYNPHNDIQAFARAHRLGQKSKVMIYRLITRNSVEERMIEVAKRKLKLEHAVVVEATKKEQRMTPKEVTEVLRAGVRELFTDDKKGADLAAPNVDEEATAGELRYDAEAIDKLLDRAQENTVDDTEQEAFGEYLSAFKVANFATADKKDGVDDGEDDDSNLFEELLKEQFEAAERLREEEESRMFGKGKRQRRAVYHNEVSDAQLREYGILYEEGSDMSDSDSSHSVGGQSSESDDFGLKSGEEMTPAQKAALLQERQRRQQSREWHRGIMNMLNLGSLYVELRGGAMSMEESNVSTKVQMRHWYRPGIQFRAGTLAAAELSAHARRAHEFGSASNMTFDLTINQRRCFLIALMRFGLGDGTWRHVTDVFATEFQGVPTDTIRLYGDALVVHLVNQPTHNWTERTRSSFLLDATVDAEGLREALLWRLFRLFQVQELVLSEERTNVWMVPPLSSYMLDDAKLSQSMETLRDVWRDEDDRILMRGMCRYGYGQWRHVLHSPACTDNQVLSLFDTLLSRCNRVKFETDSDRQWLRSFELQAVDVVRTRSKLYLEAICYFSLDDKAAPHAPLPGEPKSAEYRKMLQDHHQLVSSLRDQRAAVNSQRREVARREGTHSRAFTGLVPDTDVSPSGIASNKTLEQAHLITSQHSKSKAKWPAKASVDEAKAQEQIQKDAVMAALAAERAARVDNVTV